MFQRTALPEVIPVESIITIHCYDYCRDFSFAGEQHDFWEMGFIDVGEVCITADDKSYTLGSGEAFFHKPNEFHSIRANNVYSSVIVITFVTNSQYLFQLANQKTSFTSRQKRIISEILKEAIETFADPLDIINQRSLIKRMNAPFGAEQMLKTYLEQLLIDVVRLQTQSDERFSDANSEKRDEEQVVSQIIHVLEENIERNLSLDEISTCVQYSKSYIKTKFKKVTGLGIHQMYTQLKLSHSKKLLSENKYSMSEISEMLGFSSVHHFSKVFKSHIGMPPSVYQRSVRKRSLL